MSRLTRRFRGLFRVFGKLNLALRRFGLQMSRKWASALWSLVTFSWLKKAGRNWGNLLAGLPFLLVVFGVCYLVVACSLQSKDELSRTYLQRADAESYAKRYKSATVLYERAMEIESLTDATLFRMAQVAFKAGESAKGVSALRRISPIDQPRHAPAHFWQAARLLDKERRTAGDVRAGIQHLKHTLTLQPQNHNARAALAQTYFEYGDHQLAVLEFPKVVQHHPKLTLAYAKSLSQLGRADEAEFQGKLAQKWLREEIKKSPKDLELYYRLADCHMFLEEFQSSEAIILQLVKKEPDNLQYRSALSDLYLVWQATVTGDSVEKDRERFRYLARALMANPNNFALFDPLMKLIDDQSEVASDLVSFLNRNISEGRALGLSHFVLGTFGLTSQGENAAEQSQFHIERAMELMPNAPLVINNFAWYLLQKETPDPERALTLISPVIDQVSRFMSPKTQAQMRDTRGIALLKLGRYKDAIADFEFAIQNELHDSRSVHEALAQAYEKIGSQGLANEHRKIAAEIADATP